MSEPKMTAEERVRDAAMALPASDLDERLEAIAREVAAAPVKLPLDDAIRIAEAHAKAAVAELEAEVERLRNAIAPDAHAHPNVDYATIAALIRRQAEAYERRFDAPQAPPAQKEGK